MKSVIDNARKFRILYKGYLVDVLLVTTSHD